VLSLLSWIAEVVAIAVAECCISLISKRRRWFIKRGIRLVGRTGTLGYIWMDWRCFEVLEVMIRLAMIDISNQAILSDFSNA
jgi:hypothetical protein